MDQETRERIERKIADEARERLGDSVQQVAVLQYGDDPAIEPGELLVRLTIPAAEGRDGQEQAMHAFEGAHGAVLKDFWHDLRDRLPEAGRLEVRASGDTGHGPRLALAGKRMLGGIAGPDLTPVMARLGPVDLETLDALITAGIASSRAEAVRWALARIRERPAYAQLRERAREIDRLKNEF
jgi:hypothetical protein